MIDSRVSAWIGGSGTDGSRKYVGKWEVGNMVGERREVGATFSVHCH